MKFIGNNLPVVALAGFFAFICSFQNYVDAKYKTQLSIEYHQTPKQRGNYSDKEKSLIKAACREYLVRWQSDHQQSCPQYTIRIVREPFIDEEGNTLWGLHQEGLRLITVYVGENYEIPALYHELCHCLDSGNKHADPRWPAWRERQLQLAKMIQILRQTK